VPATPDEPPVAQKDASREALLKRLGVKPEFEKAEFPAVRETVELSRTRAVGLEPGDCELMEQLGRDVLPKLGTTVVLTNASCFPGRIPVTTPSYKFDVLVKAPTGDTMPAGAPVTKP
jgi:hypothetical protein